MSAIPGVEVRPLAPHEDPRGVLREIWRGSTQPLEIRQVIMSTTVAGALRGMHYHLRQTDLLFVPQGSVFVALLDLRRDPLAKEEFWLGEGASALIPPGVAHGYATVAGATVVYLLTTEVDGSDEFGFRFDDPAAAIAWPVADPTLSARDRGAGDLAAAIAAVRANKTQR